MTEIDHTPLEGADACCIIHTAMRKYCDSPATSAAYNFIHLIDIRDDEINVWRIYGNRVANRLNSLSEQPPTAAAIDVALRSSARGLRDMVEKGLEAHRKAGKVGDFSRVRMIATTFECLFLCFSETDYDGLAYLFLPPS